MLLVGGREVIDGNLSLGDFVAFYTYVAMLAGPMRSLGMAMGMAQRAVASGNRMFEILDREPAIQSPPGAPALPAGRRRVELRGVTLRYEGAAEVRRSPTSTSTSRPGRRWRWSGPSGPGKTSLVGADRAALRPERGHGAWSTAPTCARSTSTRCARRSPSSPTTASSSPPASPRTSPTPTRRRRSSRSKRRRGAPRPTPSSATCPTATRPGSASAASPSPAASASGSRSPAPCSPTRAS